MVSVVHLLLYTIPSYQLGTSAFPQDLKQEHSNISRIGGVTFIWNEMKCEERNGILLGYEIKLYYDKGVYTTRVAESVTMFTIVPQLLPESSFPKAISVAAINEVGAGNHCPPVNINQSG